MTSKLLASPLKSQKGTLAMLKLHRY